MAAVDPEPPGWLVIRVKSPSEESAAELSEGLIAFGASAVQEEGEDLVTWFAPPADPDAFVARLKASLEILSEAQPIRIEQGWRADEDWSRTWRAGLSPRRIGRIVVTPTWCSPEPRPDDVVVTIDPQMAFGTGEHASTRGVLRLLQPVVRHGDRVLDLGTGSGVLAISAALLGAGRVIAVDNDADALLNARENVDRNGCGATVILDHAVVDDAWLRDRSESCDLILANILSGVLVPLLRSFRTALRAGGHAILAGILEEEAAAVRSAAAAAGFREVTDDLEQGWWSVTLEARPGPSRSRPAFPASGPPSARAPVKMSG